MFTFTPRLLPPLHPRTVALCVVAACSAAASNDERPQPNRPAAPTAPFPPPPPPFGARPARDYGALALAFVLGAAATASGTGGGAMYVPIFDAISLMGVKRATALSQVCITMGALAGVVTLLMRRNPENADATLIDLNMASTLAPSILLGVSFGVLANLLLPEWIITFLIGALLLAIAVTTACKGRTLRRSETAKRVRALDLSSSSSTDDLLASGMGDRATADMCRAALDSFQNRFLPRSPVLGKRETAGVAAAAAAAPAKAAGLAAPLPPPTKAAGLAPTLPPPGKAGALPAPLPGAPPGRHPLFTRATVAPSLTLLGLWAVMTGLTDWRGRVPRCSGSWFGAIGAQVAVAAVSAGVLVSLAVAKARMGGGDEVANRTPGRLLLGSAMSVVVGFLGGLLGIGGGVMFTPLFLLVLRLDPRAAAATSTLLVLFSSSSAAIAAVGTPGALLPMYVAVFASAAALSGVVGVLLANRFVKRSGRESMLVFLLAAYVAAGALLTAAVSGPSAVASLRTGAGGVTAVCGPR